MRTTVFALALAAGLAGCEKKSSAPAPTSAPAAAQAPPVPDAAAAKAAGVEWVHPQKLISAKFPAQPKLMQQEMPTPSGTVNFTIAMHEDATRALMASALEYKLAADATFDTAQALRGAREQMLANIKAKTLSEKPVTLDGLTGTEVVFEGPGPNPSTTIRGIARLFVSDKPPGCYIAAAMTSGDAADPELVRFLDSMHVAKGVSASP